MKYLIFFLGLLLAPLSHRAQTDTTKLYLELKAHSANDLKRLNTIRALVEMHKFSPDSLIKYCNMGIKLATVLKQTFRLAEFYHFRSVGELNRADLKKAATDINVAIPLYQQLRKIKELGRALKIRAIIYYYENNYEKAISDFTKAIASFKKANYKIDLPTCYIFMAELSRNNEDKALEFYYDQKSYEVSKELYQSISRKDPDWKIVELNYIQSLGNLADHYLAKGETRRCLEYLNTALKLGADDKFLPTTLIYMANAAECHVLLGDREQGMALAKKALKLANLHQIPRAESNALSKLLQFSKTESEAENYYQQGIRIAREIGNTQLIANFLSLRADQLEAFGDYKAALPAYRKYVKYADSLTKSLRQDRISRMETSFRLRENTYKLQEVEQENRLKDARMWNFIALSIGLALFVAVLILVTIKVSRLSKKIQSQNEDLRKITDFKNLLLRIIGHDVNGLLSAMGYTLYLIKPEKLQQQEQHDFRTLAILRQEAFELLNSLMIWGDTDGKSYSGHPQQIRAMLKNEFNTIHSLAASFQKELKLEEHDFETSFNPDHLKFIVRNLALNALKYARPDTGISLFLGFQDGKKCLVVSNFVREMDIKRLGLAFDPDHLSELEKVNGNGLALKLCRSLATANGQKLEVFFDQDQVTIRLSLD